MTCLVRVGGENKAHSNSELKRKPFRNSFFDKGRLELREALTIVWHDWTRFRITLHGQNVS